jgi:hypothetical protein
MSECPVCVASRRSIVDALLVGYELGFKEAFRSFVEDAYPVGERPEMCVAHDIMVTRTHGDVVREAVGLPRTTHPLHKEK